MKHAVAPSFRLTPRQRQLIVRYGNPFAALDQQLRRVAELGSPASISIPAAQLDPLVADLARAMRAASDPRLQDELAVLLELFALDHG